MAEQYVIDASDVVAEFLHEARVRVDKEFGEGFALKEPLLVSSFMACAMELANDDRKNDADEERTAFLKANLEAQIAALKTMVPPGTIKPDDNKEREPS